MEIVTQLWAIIDETLQKECQNTRSAQTGFPWVCKMFIIRL
jgi:hypothetical protein